MTLLRHAALAAALALCACPRPVGPPALDNGTREKVEEANKLSAQGKPAEAAKILAEVKDTGSSEVADALFQVGESQFRAADFSAARASYRDLLARFPLFDRADLAKRHLAVSQLELKEYRDALQTLAPLWARVSDAERPETAAELARAAEGARAWADAVRWRAELLRVAPNEETLKRETARVFDLLEGRVAFLDVARLAQEVPVDSPVWAMVQLKLAKILAHLRDPARLHETLQRLLATAPQSQWAVEAKVMLDRADRRTRAKADTIGVLLPMSGKYKTYGESVMAGLQLALQGSEVKLALRDTQGDPVTARKMASELAQDEQVIALVGPILSSEAEDAAAEAELQETPIVTLTRSENITDIGSYVFRNMLTNGAQAKALAEYAVKVRGIKKFAVAFPKIPYGIELAHSFWDNIEALGGEMDGAESYDANETTFAEVAKRLTGRWYLLERDDYLVKSREVRDAIKDPTRQKQYLDKVVKTLAPIIDFEALFIPDWYKNVALITPSLAVQDVITNGCDKWDMDRIAKTQGKEAHELKTVQLFGANGWDFKELLERADKFVNCSIFVDGFFAGSDRRETQQFVAAFKKATGREPALLEAVGYDTAGILRGIIERSRPTTRAAFREALLKVKDFPGATGRTTVNEKREAEKPLFFLTIERKEIREIDTDVKT